MKLRIRGVLGLIVALTLAPAFWPDLGSTRAQSDRKSSQTNARAVPSGLTQVDTIEASAVPLYTPWSAPEPVQALNTLQNELPACISSDGLSLYIRQISEVTGEDLYVVHRPNLEADWGERVRLPDGINTNANERIAFVSADGSSLYFSSDRAGGTGGYDLYVSRRTNVYDDGDWQSPENLSAVNSPGLDSGPTFFEDESGATQLYFACNPEPGGVEEATDIYSSVLGPDGFEPPSRVAELSSRWADYRPYLRRDGREIYFVSNRSGSYAIYRSVRSSTAAPWSPPVAAFEPADLGDPSITWLTAPVLSWDATTLFIGVYGPDRTSGDDIFVTHRR